MATSRIPNRYGNIESEWITVDPAYNLNATKVFKCGKIKMVHLFFTGVQIRMPPKGQYTDVGTVPSGYEPSEAVVYVSYQTSGTLQIIAQYEVRIMTDGTIKVYNYTDKVLSAEISLTYF